jgi:hypothetical protein
MIVIWQHCLLKWKLSLKVKENRTKLTERNFNVLQTNIIKCYHTDEYY